MLKIIFLKFKNYFNIFLNKKQLLSGYQTSSFKAN